MNEKGEVIWGVIGWLAKMALGLFLSYLFVTECNKAIEQQKQETEEKLQQCVDHGGDVIVNQYGRWSCSFPNEELR